MNSSERKRQFLAIFVGGMAYFLIVRLMPLFSVVSFFGIYPLVSGSVAGLVSKRDSLVDGPLTILIPVAGYIAVALQAGEGNALFGEAIRLFPWLAMGGLFAFAGYEISYRLKKLILRLPALKRLSE